MNGPIYVYCVTSAPVEVSISTPGIEGSNVRAMEHGGLVALISPLQSEALRASRDLRAHWRVLQEAFEQTTVLPVRFGTVMESEQAVREGLLESNSAQLAAMLRDLVGLVQLGVKGRYDEERLLREVVRDSRAVATQRERVRGMPQGPASHGQQVRLGELVAGEVMRRHEQDLAVALSALEPLAVATRSEPSLQTGVAFDLAFLVEQEKRDAFDEAVGGLRQALEDRIKIRYIGPMPPYSFAETDLSTRAEAWA